MVLFEGGTGHPALKTQIPGARPHWLEAGLRTSGQPASLFDISHLSQWRRSAHKIPTGEDILYMYDT